MERETSKRRTERDYTEQGAFSVCHIRTVASGWNLCSFLRYFQRGPQVPLTKYGPTPAFKQTRLFLYLQLEEADKWLTSNKGPFCCCILHPHQLRFYRTNPLAVRDNIFIISGVV